MGPSSPPARTGERASSSVQSKRSEHSLLTFFTISATELRCKLGETRRRHDVDRAQTGAVTFVQRFIEVIDGEAAAEDVVLRAEASTSAIGIRAIASVARHADC